MRELISAVSRIYINISLLLGCPNMMQPGSGWNLADERFQGGNVSTDGAETHM